MTRPKRSTIWSWVTAESRSSPTCSSSTWARDAHEVHPCLLAGEADLDHVQGLEPEVHLLQHQLGEQLDEPAGVGGPHGATAAFAEGGQQRHGPHVGRELPVQAGPADLD